MLRPRGFSMERGTRHSRPAFAACAPSGLLETSASVVHPPTIGGSQALRSFVLTQCAGRSGTWTGKPPARSPALSSLGALARG